MAFTVDTLKNDLAGILHGTTVNSITNISGLIRRCALIMLTRIDPDETKRMHELTVYDGVDEYDPPEDQKDRKVTDIAPQVNRTAGDSPRSIIGNDFGKAKRNDTFRITHRDGEKVLQLIKRLTPSRKVFAHMDGNEGWAADGTGLTDLAVDRIIYAEAGSSLKFDKASGQTSGYIETSTLSSIDLTDYEDIASAFVRIWLPTTAAAAALSSLDLRWGSSSAAYWSASASAPHNRSSFKKGWNIVRFDWPTSSTGTPDVTAIDYARLTLTTTSGAINSIRVDDLFFSIGKIFDYEYYSSYPFRDEDGEWHESIPADVGDNTILNSGPTSYPILLHEVAMAAAQQKQGADAAADVNYATTMLFGEGSEPGLYSQYLEGNPTEAIQPRTSWY